jgi:hypothetical protein
MNARFTPDVWVPPSDLLTEHAGSQGHPGHVPALPGLSFRAETVVKLVNTAPAGSPCTRADP